MRTSETFAGKTVLLTGVGGYIGRSLLDYFLAEGAFVIASTKSSNVVVGPQVAHLEVDLTEVGAGVRLMTEALALRSQIDYVVNNAARQDVSLLKAETPESISDLFQANVSAIAEILTVIGRGESGVESVLNISSIEALAARPGHSIYGATKAALDSLTRSAAVELAPVRVNALRLGLIESPGIRAGWPAGVAAWQQAAPLLRMGVGSDICAGVGYLLTAPWATGSVLTLDGGIGAVAPW